MDLLDTRFTTLRFNVVIDGIPLGSFTSFEGLAASYEVKTYQEGGENSFVHNLPGRMSYTNVKLSRPMTILPLNPLTLWFRHVHDMGPLYRHTAAVMVFAGPIPVRAFEFTGVWPVKYTGPTFSTDSGKVGIEIFEFAHDGFVEVGAI